MPTPKSNDERSAVEAMLGMKRIAVVGISNDPFRPSRYVSEYLDERGYEIIPINPNHTHALNRPCLPSLSDVKGPIDLVLVFRRSEFCPEVAREAVSVGAKGLWLQSGIYSEEAKRIAEEAGIEFVQGRCMMVEHGRR